MDPGIIVQCTVVYKPVYEYTGPQEGVAKLEKHILKGNGPFDVP
jgi:hypothetical protein